jgi:hypothetical protein
MKYVQPAAVVVYLGLVVAVAFGLIPHSASDVRYAAARYLGANTRLDRGLLIASPTRTLDERLRLAREEERLVGKYVKVPVPSGQLVRSENVVLWPDLSGLEVIPVELNAEPDLFLLNEGTKVEILRADNSASQHALVLAIVKSGNKWLAMLRRSDLSTSPFGVVKEVRIETLPGHTP